MKGILTTDPAKQMKSRGGKKTPRFLNNVLYLNNICPHRFQVNPHFFEGHPT